MANLATPAFLTQLKSVYNPSRKALPVLRNAWYLVAAVAFSASNTPEAVPVVFRYALEELKREQPAEPSVDQELILARRFRECLLQSGLLSGYARAINSLVALHENMPEKLRDTEILRDTNKGIQQYAQDGRRLYEAMYGNTADSVQELLDTAYPDLGWFCNLVGYGIVYGGTHALSQVEVSFVIATANIVMDTPRQIGWHLANARNGGATLEEARAVRHIAIEVGRVAGIKWKNEIPEVN